MTPEKICAKVELLNHVFAVCSLRDRTRRRYSTFHDKQEKTYYQRSCNQCASNLHAYAQCFSNTFRKVHARRCFKCSFTSHDGDKIHSSGTYGKKDCPIINLIGLRPCGLKIKKWRIYSIHDFLIIPGCPPTENWLRRCVKRMRMEMCGWRKCF